MMVADGHARAVSRPSRLSGASKFLFSVLFYFEISYDASCTVNVPAPWPLDSSPWAKRFIGTQEDLQGTEDLKYVALRELA